MLPVPRPPARPYRMLSAGLGPGRAGQGEAAPGGLLNGPAGPGLPSAAPAPPRPSAAGPPHVMPPWLPSCEGSGPQAAAGAVGGGGHEV